MQTDFEGFNSMLVQNTNLSPEALDEKGVLSLIQQHADSLFVPRPHSPWPEKLEDILAIKSALDIDSLLIADKLKTLCGVQVQCGNFNTPVIKQFSSWIGGVAALYHQGLLVSQNEAVNQMRIFKLEMDAAEDQGSAIKAINNAFRRLKPFIQVHNALNAIAQDMVTFFEANLLNSDKEKLAQHLNMHMLASLHRTSLGDDFRVVDPQLLEKEVSVFGRIRDRVFASAKSNPTNPDGYLSIDQIVSIFSNADSSSLEDMPTASAAA